MRLVCISDTHGQHRKLTVPEGDVFIHAGDLLNGQQMDLRVRPRLFICGHVHESRGHYEAAGIHYVNVACIQGRHLYQPTVIELEVDKVRLLENQTQV